ncbi:GroES-like protein, partial [Athelia psychrophila]
MPTPNSLSAHDMLIRVAVASLCHTDGMVTAGIFKTSLPCTASHEGAGTVAALGSNVNEFHIGDRVLCGWAYGRCGMCADCTGPEESTQYCTKSGGTLGISLDGNFAEYVVVDAREANLLPGNLSFQSAAPLACAGTTIWSGIVRAELKPGEWLAIVGAGGGLGHLGVQMAKAQGLNVIGIDAQRWSLSVVCASLPPPKPLSSSPSSALKTLNSGAVLSAGSCPEGVDAAWPSVHAVRS